MNKCTKYTKIIRKICEINQINYFKCKLTSENKNDIVMSVKENFIQTIKKIKENYKT